MRKQAASALLLLLLPLAACGGEQFDPGEFDVGGRWTGETEIVRTTAEVIDTARYQFVFDLEQSEDQVSGSGEVRGETETVEVEIDGDWDYPTVDFVVSAPGYAPMRFRGNFDVDSTFVPSDTIVVVSPDSLIGTLNGSAFSNTRLDIGRETPVGTQ